MSETCPICGNIVNTQDSACPSCGFRLPGSTQKFAPIVMDGEVARPVAKTTSVPMNKAAANASQSSASATDVQLASLSIVRGPQTGTTFELKAQTLSVGRSPHCDIFLNDMTVSRIHANLEKTAQGYSIADENSFNGIWVNNENVEEKRLLEEGDIVQIGAFCLLYQKKGN